MYRWIKLHEDEFYEGVAYTELAPWLINTN